MKASGLFATLLTGAALLISPAVAADASSVPRIVTLGKHFFYSNNGSEFFMRGVAYQENYNANASAASNANYVDPLANVDDCNRDIPYLLELRTNLIRTYAIDPTNDHSGCMNAFAAAGIYVISDLSSPEQSINSDDPAWTDALYARYAAVIDDLSQYNNVIGFFAGNEVTDSTNTTAASAFVKAAVRDSKAYIQQKGYKTYVGYASYDGPIRAQLADYFNCGDPSTTVDFWGYNIYSWCGDSNYVQSDYEARTDFFRNYSVPAFFAEYGCIHPQPRTFTEVAALFGPNMTSVWSGGIVYMYFQEVNDYGLVNVNGNSVTKLPGFAALSSQQAMASPSSTAMSAYTQTNLPAQSCPTVDSSWQAIASPLPPTPNGQLCQCLMDSLTCVVKNSTDSTTYEDLFSYICGNNPGACKGIQANGTSGEYAAFSGCDPQEQLAYVMNEYYNIHSQNSQACDFSGAATMQSPSPTSGSCSALLADAGGQAGTGTVPPPTGSIVAPAGSTTSTSNHKSTASHVTKPFMDWSIFAMAVYVAIATVSGAGMLLL